MEEITGDSLHSLPGVKNSSDVGDSVSIQLPQCRLCVSTDERTVPIFSEQGKKLHLAYRINKLLPTMISPVDMLPQGVCYSCIKELNSAYEFVLKCMLSQAKLQNMLNKWPRDYGTPLKVLQDYSAHWSVKDGIEDVGVTRKLLTMSSEELNVGNEEESMGETERNGLFKKIKLCHQDNYDGSLESSVSVNNADMNEENTDYPLLDINDADDNISVGNDSVIENNDVKAEEVTAVCVPESNSSEKKLEDEHRSVPEVKYICKFCEEGFPWKADLFEHQLVEHSELVIRCSYCLKIFYDKDKLAAHEEAHEKLYPPGQLVKKYAPSVRLKKKKRDEMLKNSLNLGNDCLPGEGDGVNVNDSNEQKEEDRTCYYCFLLFPTVKLYRRHVRREHKLRFPCRLCAVTCHSIYLHRRHENGHKKRALKRLCCMKCKKLFYFEIELRDHSLIHCHKDGLKCEICGEAFTREEILEDHLKVHDGEECYLCEVCGENIESFFLFRVHKLSHMYPDLHKCELCNFCFNSLEDLDCHLGVAHKKKQMHCYICDQAFISRDLLREHTASHSSTEFDCKVCGKTFTRIRNLRVHLDVHSVERRYLCDKCGKGYRGKESLRNHLALCQAPVVPCNVCGRKFTGTARLDVHMKIHRGERTLLCATCGKGFHTTWALNQHMVTHRAAEIPCPICGILFVTKPSMLTHLRRHRVACDTCGQVFANTPLLVAHQKTHLEKSEKPVTDETSPKFHGCDVCGNQYLTALALRHHQPVHSEERPYKCNLCSKSYKRAKDLAKHTDKSHRAPKPYRCRFCSCTFRTQPMLVKHENGHTVGKPFRCQVCGLGFWSPLSLEKHIIKHNGVSSLGKKYSCKFCGRLFSLKSSFMLHKNSHIRHLDYKCPFCPRKFSRPVYLRKHKCVYDPSRWGDSSTSLQDSLPSMPPLIEEAPTVVLDGNFLLQVQPEVQDGGKNNGSDSTDFYKHLKTVVESNSQDVECDDESDIQSSEEEEEFMGPLHPHLQCAHTSKTVQLVDGIPVYISKRAFQNLSARPMSSTALARNLLEEVFTREALLECSVKGQRPNSRNEVKQRDSLPSSGINAIIEFVQKINDSRGRPPIKSSDIVMAMGHRLSELRKRSRSKPKLEEVIEEQVVEIQIY